MHKSRNDTGRCRAVAICERTYQCSYLALSLYAGLTLPQGETSVKILTSIREKDVFVVQSGSSKINDSIMELLILISACKGGSANKITGALLQVPHPVPRHVNCFY